MTLVNSFLVFMALMGSIFLLPIFAQTFLGYDATQTGYLFLLVAFMITIAAPLDGSLIGKVKSQYVIAVSTLIGGLGMFLFTALDPRSTTLNLMIPLAVTAFGIGFGMSQRTNIVASSVPQHEVGVASSLLALVRNISGAFGIALFTTILQNETNKKVREYAAHTIVNIHVPTVLKEVTALVTLTSASYRLRNGVRRGDGNSGTRCRTRALHYCSRRRKSRQRRYVRGRIASCFARTTNQKAFLFLLVSHADELT
ncbi:hypothetical protein COV04_03850 [Candidatus Uhrbacteria bacterium CG10_big_fil_rev_8_21_14_0_10_48_11]|uniref:Major facilitator superfamily (MFS) profile domain-containing protein n=1 Tax=Candidatus Uhrbacteria bacterium CG10_big_fil_rev_8_21_14_0_10_48_11 TaxID=1975037 RepID=A0A2M8LE46_9BACT|nr:MAG: hypothetical protein COV04_03850 [Candidatus Uhrbacteria bacterium CG10_big_fil_rev_8_21_14_0_10_48_11]